MNLFVRLNRKNVIAALVFCFLTIICFLTNNSEAHAQGNPNWYFVFAYNQTNYFPGPNYLCPLDSELPDSSNPPETVIAYSYDQIVYPPPFYTPIYRLDRS